MYKYVRKIKHLQVWLSLLSDLYYKQAGDEGNKNKIQPENHIQVFGNWD